MPFIKVCSTKVEIVLLTNKLNSFPNIKNINKEEKEIEKIKVIISLYFVFINKYKIINKVNKL
tara:strand:+ start:499 stop:687 length:189 start_codon:yes stop_codon:yes gene_type:complete